jgi:hypothetical protein
MAHLGTSPRDWALAAAARARKAREYFMLAVLLVVGVDYYSGV